MARDRTHAHHKNMNGRTLILLIVAVAIAVVTVVVVKSHSGSSDNGPKILVAINDIPAGGFIRADKDLAWIDWPQGNVSSAYITPDTHQIDEFNGAVARRDFAANEPISLSSIIRATEGGFMSAVLTPGMRAISIAVSLTSGNAGFVFPGDKVDLLLTHKINVKDGGDSVLASETFIQDVRVLAIDQMLENPENKATVAKTITLEVTPKQAEMINVATSLGSISVSLRSLSRNAKSTPAAAKPAAAATSAAPAKPATDNVPVQASGSAPEPDDNYSTDNDVSKLMGDKSGVHAKVSVYHGSATEVLDFHQGNK
jgi:pilus assembly protein CpaB